MRRVRIATCQLRSHPALLTGSVDHLAEPFPAPSGTAPLGRLAARGLDVAELQATCRSRYLAWYKLRLEQIVAYLDAIEPPPDLVLFPEGSVPVDALGILSEWSAKKHNNILAGSHTPVDTTLSRPIYRKVGLPDNRRDILKGTHNLLPFLRNGKMLPIAKTVLSPFETSSTTLRAAPQPLASHPIQTTTLQSLRIVPVNCSEALQLPRIPSDCDLASIIALDGKPEQFQALIRQLVANHKPVAFCNDASAGGSFIWTTFDSRQSDWLLDAYPSGLPPEDAILIADLDLDTTVVEYGTAAPRPPITYVRLASITHERAPCGEISRQLDSIRATDEPSVRAALLGELLRSPKTSLLQRQRIAYLQSQEHNGFPTDAAWQLLGHDCVVSGVDDLATLEAVLANLTRDRLSELIANPGPTPEKDVAALLISSLRVATACATPLATAKASTHADTSLPPIIGRDEELRTLHDYLDRPANAYLEVAGLLGIGKTRIIESGLHAAGLAPILRLTLEPGTTPDYLLYSVIEPTLGQPRPPYAAPLDLVRSGVIPTALGHARALIIQQAHVLLDVETPSDPVMIGVLQELVRSAATSRVRVLLETQRHLPPLPIDPVHRQRQHIKGLAPDAAKRLLGHHLRRLELEPSELAADQLDAILNPLGGHPVLLALAADAVDRDGIQATIDRLRKGSGFKADYLERLLTPSTSRRSNAPYSSWPRSCANPPTVGCWPATTRVLGRHSVQPFASA